MTYITALLSLIFVLSGSAKLAGLEFEIQAFDRWGYALWFMYAIGVAEIAGGLALWWSRMSAWASIGLNMLMMGAVGTHILNAEWGMLAIASAIFGLSLWRTWQGRAAFSALYAPGLVAQA
ncbi:MAG: DoxX family protein [Aquabacterium sp.]|jgi:uncharacterized membrane protein YphA (DoxX/SURF4 family)